jgi:hypothetical protein
VSHRRVVTLGRLVHFVQADYECPAMIVSTQHHVDDEDIMPEDDTVHLHVHHPLFLSGEDREDDPLHKAAFVELVYDVEHDANPRANTYHWHDECRRS